MTETRGRVFDELGRLMTDAAGAAAGVRREIETLGRQQVARIIADLDLVRRDEFEAVKAMASRAREENERLEARIAAPNRRRSPLRTGPRRDLMTRSGISCAGATNPRCAARQFAPYTECGGSNRRDSDPARLGAAVGGPSWPVRHA
jgi:BMFP domain-containing protein YqiC